MSSKISTTTPRLLTCLAAALASAPARTASAHDTTIAAPATVRIQTASASLPIIAAQSNGFFADENLTVAYSLFTSSKTAFQQMEAGDLEAIVSSADNAVNYRVNPHNAAGALLHDQIIFGHDLGLGLALAALPGFPTAESLRGQRVAVDQPGSGFALAAAEILRAHGLEAGVDYTFVVGGASPARLAGLLAVPPTFEAAILNADSIVRARDAGFPVIGAVTDVISRYMGGVGIANEAWLAAHPDVAVRFVRAFYRGMQWICDPSNRAAAIAMIVDASTPVALATAIYDAAVDPTAGLSRRAHLSRSALLNVLRLRDEFGGFETPQDLEYLASPASGLYDLSYYHEAVRSLWGHHHRDHDHRDSCEHL